MDGDRCRYCSTPLWASASNVRCDTCGAPMPHPKPPPPDPNLLAIQYDAYLVAHLMIDGRFKEIVGVTRDNDS
jgi:hypothetical protein